MLETSYILDVGSAGTHPNSGLNHFKTFSALSRDVKMNPALFTRRMLGLTASSGPILSASGFAETPQSQSPPVAKTVFGCGHSKCGNCGCCLAEARIQLEVLMTATEGTHNPTTKNALKPLSPNYSKPPRENSPPVSPRPASLRR